MEGIFLAEIAGYTLKQMWPFCTSDNSKNSQAMRKGSVLAEARVGVMYAHGQDWFLK